MKIAIGFICLLFPALVQPAGIDKSKQDLECLKANIFFEARGESVKGKQAVAKVTLNRVRSNKYPSSVCKVVFQKFQFSWVFQQPWGRIQKVMKGDLRGYNTLDRVAYLESKKTAETALKMRLNVLPDSALWYHHKSIKPSWARKMQKVKTVGSHIFYVQKDLKK